MRKGITSCLVALLLVAVSVGTVGCDFNMDQAKAVSRIAGLYSAVGWIALDNPGTNEIAAVASIMDVIEQKASDVQAGASYVAVVYPEVEKVIDKDVEAQYRPLCKAGALSILGGIDILFAANPDWKVEQDDVIEIVNAYILGAKEGLALKVDNPIMIQARNIGAKRVVTAGGEIQIISVPGEPQTKEDLILLAIVALLCAIGGYKFTYVKGAVGKVLNPSKKK